MFEAHFDCSGTAKTHHGVVVGGCVSSKEQWARMEPDWNEILEQEGVREINGYRALHMKDLAASKRAFEGWTEAQKAALLGRLARLMRARVHFLVGCGMPVSVYRQSQVVITKTEGWAPNPLTFVAASCVEEVGGYCIRNRIEGEVMEYIFEDGDPNRGEIQKLMTNIRDTPSKRADFRYAGHRFGGKSVVGLQAADWVAYEAFLWGTRDVLPQYGEGPVSNRPMRRSLRALAEIPNSIAFFGTVEDVLASVKDRADRFFRDAGLSQDEYLARIKARVIAKALTAQQRKG